MKILTLVVGQLQTNCYLAINESNFEALIIDPGDDADYISRQLNDAGVKPKAIVVTHGHFDHILAAVELQLAYGIPFLIHGADEFLIRQMNSSANFFTDFEGGIPPQIDAYLADKQVIKLGKYSFQVLATPGHTPGSISLYNASQKLLLCGDLIFAEGGLGRTDFSYSSKDDFDKSVKKILQLPGETKIYPGHGASSTINRVSKYFPAL